MKNILKYSSASLAIALGLGAGFTSMYMNVSHGLESSTVDAITLGIGDMARICVPVMALRYGWSKALKIGILLLAITSVYNILSYQANIHAAPVWESMQAEQKKLEREEQVRNLTTEIAGFAEKRTAKGLRDLAETEGTRKGCGNNCMAFKAAVEVAERREALEAKRNELAAQNEAVKPIEVKGWSVALVAAGVNPLIAKVAIDALNASWRLLALDALVYLLIPGLLWFRKEQQDTALASHGVVIKAKPEGKVKVKKEDAYEALVTRLLALPDNRIVISERQLAKELGVSKSSLNGWLKSWAAKLEVKELGKFRKSVSLKKAA